MCIVKKKQVLAPKDSQNPHKKFEYQKAQKEKRTKRKSNEHTQVQKYITSIQWWHTIKRKDK